MLSVTKTNGTALARPYFSELVSSYPLPSIIFRLDNFEIASYNRHIVQLFGYGSGEFETLSLLQLFSEPDSLRLFRQAHSARDSQFCFEAVQSRKGGSSFNSEMHVSLLTSHPGWALATIIVKSSPVAAPELQNELRKYQTFIENSSEGIFCQEFLRPLPLTLSPEEMIAQMRDGSYISECNDAMAKMYGFSRADELKGTLISQLIDFSDEANTAFFHHFISNGFRVSNAVSHEKDQYGKDKYFLNNALGVIEHGELKRIWGTQQDITERRQTEEQLRLLANLVEQTSDVLTASDVNYYPVTWNKAAERIYGLTAEQVIGRDLRDYITIHYTNTTRDVIRRAIEDNGEWRGESYFVRPSDGKTVYLWIYFKALFDESGKHLGFLVSAVDISDRKEAESRLRESENRFREMADSSPVMIWMSDQTNTINYLNQKWIDFTGVNIVGKGTKGWASLVHLDDIAEAKSTFHKAFEARRPVTIVYRLLFADGSYRWVHDVSVPRFLADGTFIGYIGSVVDIQDQKEKENQLAYQAMILENVSDVIVTTDLQFRVRSWNSTAEMYYEMSEADAIGHKMSELIDFQFYETSLAEVISNLQTQDQWAGEASFVSKAGETRYFNFSLKGIYDEKGSKIGYLSTGRDITEKKIASEKLIKSEEFYRTLIADSLDGMLLVNNTGEITFASPSIRNTLGFDPEDITGRSMFNYVHSEDLVWALQSFEKELIEQPEVKFIVIRLLKKNGDWCWCMVRGHNLLANPAVGSIVIYFHDDTLRKQASEALKESERKFRSLVRDLQVGVFLSGADGSTQMCNNALCELLTMPEEAILGSNIYDLLFNDMIDERGEPIATGDGPLTKALHTKETVNGFVVGVLHPVTRERTWIMVNAEPILDEHNELKHVVCSVMDLTERKALEKQLVSEQITRHKELTQASIDGQEAERREIGKELHDNIGQQLTTVKLFLDMAKGPAENSANEMISLALKGVSDLINEIRTISRSLVPSTLQDLGLVESIKELTDSISRSQVITINFGWKGFEESRLPENYRLALFRIVQEQLNNIVKYAKASSVDVSLSTENGQAILNVKDDGCGFDLRKVRRGLGFKNIKNRAELLGGKKEIFTSPGKGCQLRVTLPLPKPVMTEILQ